MQVVLDYFPFYFVAMQLILILLVTSVVAVDRFFGFPQRVKEYTLTVDFLGYFAALTFLLVFTYFLIITKSYFNFLDEFLHKSLIDFENTRIFLTNLINLIGFGEVLSFNGFDLFIDLILMYKCIFLLKVFFFNSFFNISF